MARSAACAGRRFNDLILFCIMLKTSLIFRSFRKAGLWNHFCLVQYWIFVILLEEDSIQPFLRCILYCCPVIFLHFQLHYMNFQVFLIMSICSFDVDLDCGWWFKFCHRSKIILSWTIHDQIIIEMIAFPDHDNCQSLLSLFYIASCVHARAGLKIIACESTESIQKSNVTQQTSKQSSQWHLWREGLDLPTVFCF